MGYLWPGPLEETLEKRNPRRSSELQLTLSSSGTGRGALRACIIAIKLRLPSEQKLMLLVDRGFRPHASGNLVGNALALTVLRTRSEGLAPDTTLNDPGFTTGVGFDTLAVGIFIAGVLVTLDGAMVGRKEAVGTGVHPEPPPAVAATALFHHKRA